MDIKIHKIKRKKHDSLYIEYDKIQKGVVQSNEATNYGYVAHPDLLECFDLLKMHLGLLTEYHPEKNAIPYFKFDRDQQLKYAANSIKDIRVTQLIFKGESEKAGVTLCGYKILMSGKVVNVTAPFVRFDADDDSSEYEFNNKLYELCVAVQAEVEQYISGEKKDDSQMNIFELEKKEKDAKKKVA